MKYVFFPMLLIGTPIVIAGFLLRWAYLCFMAGVAVLDFIWSYE